MELFDSGMYVCAASNRIGKAMKKTELVVVGESARSVCVCVCVCVSCVYCETSNCILTLMFM